MKTRHKITLLFTLIVTGILLLVSVSVYYFTSLERSEIFRKRLRSRAGNNAEIHTYFRDGGREMLDRINESAAEMLPRKFVSIYGLTGELKYSYQTPEAEPVPATPRILRQAITAGEYYFMSGKTEAIARHFVEEGYGFIVVVGGYDEDGWEQLGQLRQIFLFSFMAATVISFVAGSLFSRQLVKPIARMIAEAQDISSHNLSHRIHVGPTADELNQLAATFNELLDRLQESFDSQRRFISNASHELSTPLTSILSQLQVALQRDRGMEEYRRVLLSVQEDVVLLRQLTKSLLEMAKAGSQGIELDVVRIDEVLFRVMGDIRKINAEYSVELHYADAAEDENRFLVFGNADLLYIAIRNLVENGCKYSPDHRARINLSFTGGLMHIDISSRSTTLPDEELARIFQPFYRAANAAGTGGFGLGLALAKRIVGLHKGTLEVYKDGEETLRFRVTHPLLETGG